MTANTIRQIIESRVATEMALNPAYPVNYENTVFTPPNTTPWLQVFIRYGDSSYATLMAPATGLNKQNGVVTINIFTPVGAGTAANLTIANRVKQLFDRQIVSGIIFDGAAGPAPVGASVIQGGVSASSGLAAAYFQTQLTITFETFV